MVGVNVQCASISANSARSRVVNVAAVFGEPASASCFLWGFLPSACDRCCCNCCFSLNFCANFRLAALIFGVNVHAAAPSSFALRLGVVPPSRSTTPTPLYKRSDVALISLSLIFFPSLIAFTLASSAFALAAASSRVRLANAVARVVPGVPRPARPRPLASALSIVGVVTVSASDVPTVVSLSNHVDRDRNLSRLRAPSHHNRSSVFETIDTAASLVALASSVDART